MAEFTENYGLEKPDQNEFYDVDVQNQNMDKIDQAIAAAGNNPQLEIDVAEIKDKIGSTADTGGTKAAGTVMAKENAILGEVGKIGAPNDAGSSNTTSTSINIFAKLNYLISQLPANYIANIYSWCSSLASAIGSRSDAANSATSASSHGKLNWFLNLFGKTDDTGGTETVGTVLGKLNKLILDGAEEEKRSVSDNDIIRSCLNYSSPKFVNLTATETEVLNISGGGFVNLIEFLTQKNYKTTVKIYVDDELYFDFGANPSSGSLNLLLYFGCDANTGSNAHLYGKLQNLSLWKGISTNTSGGSNTYIPPLLHFYRSLRVVASSMDTSVNSYVKIGYGLKG